MRRDQILDVWGELACFTRPELKVERFSYPVITPSAARGIFDAIYCKPSEFRWQVTCIELLRQVSGVLDTAPSASDSYPNYIALRRNEVKEKGPGENVVHRWATGKEEPVPIFADAGEEYGGGGNRGRTQRQTIALKNVRYRLHAEVRPWPGFESRVPAIEEQFRRRAAHGKCFFQPCFGCREFPAYFRLVDNGEPADRWPYDADLGFIIYDVFDLSRPGSNEDDPSISVFPGIVRGGVMTVPDFESAEVRKIRRAG